MKVLFISKSGDGLGVAHRIREEGHDVQVWIKEAAYANCGKGLVGRPASFRPHLASADLIICDMVGFGGLERLFKSYGKPVLSCNSLTDKLELDREAASILLEKLGVAQPPHESYNNIAEAKKALFQGDWKPVVLKPHGNKDTSMTTVCKEKELAEWVLSRFPASTPLTVQSFVKGVEVSTEGWWNGRDFIKPFNHTFEEKKFLQGNLGQNTGCMGNVVVTSGSNRLTKETVEKLRPFLMKTTYRGPIDLNAIVTPEKAFVLEASCRMGYDAIEALLEGLREPVLDLLFETAAGTKKEMDITQDTMIAVRLSTPPYPMAKGGEKYAGEPILGVNRQNFKHLWFMDAYLTKEGFFTGGADGCILKATAHGRRNTLKSDLVGEARNRVYRTLDGLHVGSKQYRLDIGERVNGDWQKLKEWGWVDG